MEWLSSDRRGFMRLAGAAALATAAAPARAAWPDRTIRVVVSSAPGDGVDLRTREFLASLAPELGNPTMFVDNKPGAGGQIAAQSLLGSPADGYTLFVANAGMTIIPSYFRKLPFNPLNDFAPVAVGGIAPVGLAVPVSNPAGSLKEWLEWARKQPGLNYGSSSNGTVSSLYGFQVNEQFGLKAANIPYKSTSLALLDVARGQNDFMMLDILGLRALTEKGDLKILATTGTERSKYLPDVPTFKELGHKGFERTGWTVYVVRKGTPAPIVQALADAINKTNGSAQWERKREELWSVWKPLSISELEQQFKTETKEWGALVARSGVYGN
ncbi:tripartite tricarboxylate transporter substrate binding protein [Pigmentiphaga sp. YJ18]